MKSEENPQCDQRNSSNHNNFKFCAKPAPTADHAPRLGVYFDKVTIQEYMIKPGDNPGGTTGCPLTIGWEPISLVTLDFDIYENVRSQDRRGPKDLLLVSAHRERILQELGHSKKAILAGTKAANQTRRNRYQTIARLKSSKSHEMLEDVSGKIRNFLNRGETKRDEQKLLGPYLKGTNRSVKRAPRFIGTLR